VINAIHSVGFRVQDWNKPIPQLEGELFDNSKKEYAHIENNELVFPVTPYNYRLIILQAPRQWTGANQTVLQETPGQ
jgi:hypothetical protein